MEHNGDVTWVDLWYLWRYMWYYMEVISTRYTLCCTGCTV